MSRDPINDWIDEAIEADPIDLDIDEFDEPSGPPLSPEEIDVARASLARWQSPDMFKAAVDALCARCESKDWFNRPQLKFLHDAFVLARFARLQHLDHVCLAEPSAQWPDGFVRVAGKTHNIEVTSTHGGRKLGEEYRQVRGPKMDPVEDWVARGDSIPRYLDETISAKTKKRYVRRAGSWSISTSTNGVFGKRKRKQPLRMLKRITHPRSKPYPCSGKDACTSSQRELARTYSPSQPQHRRGKMRPSIHVQVAPWRGDSAE
jgi:hypothetical protein